MKSLLGNAYKAREKITLIENDQVIYEDKDIAETFSEFFKTAVESLDIASNEWILSDTDNQTDPVQKVVKKFDNHPSIIEIKKKY